MSKVPHFLFDTSEFLPAERFQRYFTAASDYELSLPDGEIAETFQARVDVWLLDDIIVADTNISPTRFGRSRRKAGTDGYNAFAFTLLCSGGGVADFDDHPVHAAPGKVWMYDLSRPFNSTFAASHAITLRVARDCLTPAISPELDPHGLVFGEASGRILADHLLMLRRRLAVMDEREARQAAKATIGLLRGCLVETSSSPDRRNDKILRRAMQDIDSHLAGGDLTIAAICRRIGVSRSVLYRAFANLSGVSEYIRGRRLETVHILLQAGTDQWDSQIAAEYGFVSHAHFSHSFRQRYGYSPRHARSGDLRNLASIVDSHAAADVFHAWLAKLG